MNKNIKLAVAGAILATASVANAGIVIPAGDWTLDVSGNVNMYTSWSRDKISAGTITGGLTGAYAGVNGAATTSSSSQNKFGNGLLPNFLSFAGSTRQNDLDVTFLISLQPGSAQNRNLQQVGTNDGAAAASAGANGGLNNRQAFITFGDKSWGSVKVGKDLGIFASDAILNDITLLGVGGAYAGAAGNTSLGRIGYGYIYADWKPQIAYTTPNFSGFQATVGISQAFVGNAESVAAGGGALVSSTVNSSPAYEGKASYAFNANGVDGKVWVSGISQHMGSFKPTPGTASSLAGANVPFGNNDSVAYAGDIGANVKVAGFDLTGYYYAGSGIGATGQFRDGYGLSGTAGQLEARDSNGGYVQAKYTLPTKTIAALSWGTSSLDRAAGEAANTNLVDENTMWDAMLIHPLTKHLNLVAEYSNQKSQNNLNVRNTANVGSLGAILFF